ncbi:uncharacterized protein F5147DRAFT_31423 [Suillus discolor]|uniref:Secreted protein n=1 Tax=Suillus discolor TaxID=1912936 RepID=A0A9P7EV47_9AGAM|nr:uncharacterized protein F5147DRAFT_31423 [Suillus discolor]KAG2089867.1 hypothetical protein F5147DRAFT_31423 [Suillus discolor]
MPTHRRLKISSFHTDHIMALLLLLTTRQVTACRELSPGSTGRVDKYLTPHFRGVSEVCMVTTPNLMKGVVCFGRMH